MIAYFGCFGVLVAFGAPGYFGVVTVSNKGALVPDFFKPKTMQVRATATMRFLITEFIFSICVPEYNPFGIDYRVISPQVQ
jgi:hypothetical protein